VTSLTPNQRRLQIIINRRRVTSMQEIRSKLSAEMSNIFTGLQASLLSDPGLALATDDDVDDDEDNHRDEELL
jgi:hypothetical protein